LRTFLKNFAAKWKLCWAIWKEVNDMATVYATLIIKSTKTFADVPALLREQVREILAALDVPELAE